MAIYAAFGVASGLFTFAGTFALDRPFLTLTWETLTPCAQDVPPRDKCLVRAVQRGSWRCYEKQDFL